jgi:hypothetical protein
VALEAQYSNLNRSAINVLKQEIVQFDDPQDLRIDLSIGYMAETDITSLLNHSKIFRARILNLSEMPNLTTIL